MRKVLMEMERKDKKCQALEEELVRKESALKISKATKEGKRSVAKSNSQSNVTIKFEDGYASRGCDYNFAEYKALSRIQLWKKSCNFKLQERNE
ncbi:hypothetical protein LWI28_006391 [Acer negundo]|uniref:Uncharacterized protein n=1 Tax=Acer negundo TaxID=4023 RepID=A0AAD5I8L4_ACENE|nr:hypothetical protein LWI28_006391 [Acer negundo]